LTRPDSCGHRPGPEIPVTGQDASLTIASRFEELARVHSWLSDLSERYRLPETVVFKLDLILNEALANVIGYAHPDRPAEDIQIRLDNGKTEVVLEIVDRGTAFDPFAVPEPARPGSLEAAEIGGLGIGLIKAHCDAWEYRRIADHNHMRLTVRKPPEPPRPPASRIGARHV
jgi:serine/threonine-protein kinase RsbW/sigma-B regulation protein RsbU (phosphoserine phosphatase)